MGERVGRSEARARESVRRLCQQPSEAPAPAVGSGGQGGAPGSPRCLVPGLESVKQEEELGEGGEAWFSLGVL